MHVETNIESVAIFVESIYGAGFWHVCHMPKETSCEDCNHVWQRFIDRKLREESLLTTPWAIKRCHFYFYHNSVKLHKVVRQQNLGAVEDFMLPYSAVYIRIQNGRITEIGPYLPKLW